jgi:hypothetical protein
MNPFLVFAGIAALMNAPIWMAGWTLLALIEGKGTWWLAGTIVCGATLHPVAGLLFLVGHIVVGNKPVKVTFR